MVGLIKIVQGLFYLHILEWYENLEYLKIRSFWRDSFFLHHKGIYDFEMIWLISHNALEYSV